jgi:hypothetical protein
MVTDSPTETMKSTVPAASPPNNMLANNMLAKSIAAFTDDPVGRQYQTAAPRVGGTASLTRFLGQN